MNGIQTYTAFHAALALIGLGVALKNHNDGKENATSSILSGLTLVPLYLRIFGVL